MFTAVSKLSSADRLFDRHWPPAPHGFAVHELPGHWLCAVPACPALPPPAHTFTVSVGPMAPLMRHADPTAGRPPGGIPKHSCPLAHPAVVWHACACNCQHFPLEHTSPLAQSVSNVHGVGVVVGVLVIVG